MVGVSSLVLRSEDEVPESDPVVRASVTVGAVVSTVTARADDVALLPAMSVIVAVSDLAPSAPNVEAVMST